MKKTELITDWHHWLFGVNWSKAIILDGPIRFTAFHFGPWTLLLSGPDKAA